MQCHARGSERSEEDLEGRIDLHFFIFCFYFYFPAIVLIRSRTCSGIGWSDWKVLLSPSPSPSRRSLLSLFPPFFGFLPKLYIYLPKTSSNHPSSTSCCRTNESCKPAIRKCAAVRPRVRHSINSLVLVLALVLVLLR